MSRDRTEEEQRRYDAEEERHRWETVEDKRRAEEERVVARQTAIEAGDVLHGTFADEFSEDWIIAAAERVESVGTVE